MKKYYTFLELLFPQARAEIVRLLFKRPHKERYVRELAQMSGVTLCTIQDELRKLRALQLVTDRSNRYHRFYRANSDHPLFAAFVQIAEISERSPEVRHAVAYRRRKPRAVPRKQHLPPDRPLRWDLFSKRPKRT